MAQQDDDIGDWIEAEASGGGLAVLGWGLGSVAALVLAFASWQYAPSSPSVTASARSDFGQPDPSEITGSIPTSHDEGRSSVQPTRTFGMGRLAPLPLAGDETPATSRDIDGLRIEIAEIRRRILQIGMAGEGVSRRIDNLEERVATVRPADPANLPAIAAVRPADPSPPPTIAALPAEPAAAEPPAAEKPRSEPRTADRLPLPVPRPQIEAPQAARPQIEAPQAARPQTDPPVAPTTVDGDGPATTGTVPRPARLPDKPGGELRSGAPTAKAEPAVTPSTTTPETVSETAGEPSPPRSVRVITAPTVDTFAAASPGTPTVQSAAAAPSANAPAAIDLGSFRSLAALRRAWSYTATRNGVLTKNLEPLARLRETETGMEARLLAGPFPDPTEAAKACLRLKATGALCSVSTYTGQPIAGLR